MASETLSFDILAKDAASPAFAKLAGAAQDASGNIRQVARDLTAVGRMRAAPVLAIDDKDARAKLDAVRTRLADLSGKAALARVGVDDKDAQAKLAAFGVKLDALGRKTADPRITVDGVARAEAQLLAVDAAIDKAAVDLAKMGVGGELFTSLQRLKTAMSQLGIADIADINVKPGQLRQQLILLKRMFNQVGLSDLLDININQADIAAQVSKLARVTEKIPVSFAVAGGAPKFGSGGTEKIRAQVTGTEAVLALGAAADAAQAELGKLAAAQRKAAAAEAAAIPLWTAGAGKLGALGGSVQLFGGALTGLGVPAILASAAGLHILIDAATEAAAVIIPAGIAFGAFGVAAIPALKNIYAKMQAVYTTSTALGQSIYPLTGGFAAMAAAVQPKVYQLFGEALAVMQHNTGILTTVAVGAGSALDTMGARAAVALTSGGMGTFLAEGPAALAKIGDIIGNIFGTVGSLLRVMPGYAQVLLDALDGVTRGLEALVSSPVGQWAAGAFLAFHGFVLWGGLAATAAVSLGNALVGLAAKFGLAETGALAFDAASFGTGIKLALSYAGDLGTALFTMAGAEDAAAAASGVLEGAFIALGAVNPMVWAGLAAAAIGGLIYWFTSAKSAARSYADSVQQAIGKLPATQLSTQLLRQQSAASLALAGAQKTLTGSQQHLAAAASQSTAQYADQSFGLSGVAAQTTRAKGTVDSLTRSVRAQAQAIADNKALIPVLARDMANYSAALKAAGGNTSFLAGTSISLNDAVTKGGQTLQEYELEVQANADAQQALALGIGRSAAAQNAQTNTFLTSTIPAMQKVITAEDQVLSVITGGQTAFNAFQQSIAGTTAKFVQPSGLADAAKLAKGSLGGLGQQSLAFSNTLYSVAIPALQKTIDALELQDISTGNLTTAVATGAGQILRYTGSSKEARSVIVDLINNALGPGTVSLQTLSKWVSQNSTTLAGFNAIVAKSTVGAGNLASTLKGLLNAQFQQDILAASGASAALKTYTGDLVHNTAQTAQGKDDRQRLITDLENSGLSALKAKAYVDGLQASINAMHGKNVPVGVTGSGSGGVVITTSGIAAAGQGNVRFHAAAGALIRAGTGPAADDVPAMLSRGELVVPAHMVRAGLADNLRGMIPGFAAGGFAGTESALSRVTGVAAGIEGRGAAAAMAAGVRAAIAREKAAVAQAAATKAAGLGNLPLGLGPHSGSAAVAQAFAKSILWAYGWGPGQFPPLQALWNQESGWNSYAVNPSSGAYGIPQALGHGHPYNLGDYQAQIRWGLAYISQRYGNPSAAWAHEVANNWYAQGGLVPGYASGGVAGQGAAYLKAWQDRHGGGFGAAWGPIPVNPQIDAMVIAQHRASVLAGASGLTSGQHRQWAAAAADRSKRVAALTAERAAERTWRSALDAGDTRLASWISAAGNTPSLRADAAAWKAQLSWQKWTIGRISAMLGLSAAQVAAAQKAGTLGPGGAALPKITHTYGGDIANTTGAFLSSAAAPFGAAKGGLVMDSGGWLRPGWNPPMFNNTGRPEHLVPARGGGGDIHLHLTVQGPVGSQQQLEDWYVKTANKLAQHGRLTQAVKAASR